MSTCPRTVAVPRCVCARPSAHAHGPVSESPPHALALRSRGPRPSGTRDGAPVSICLTTSGGGAGRGSGCRQDGASLPARRSPPAARPGPNRPGCRSTPRGGGPLLSSTSSARSGTQCPHVKRGEAAQPPSLGGCEENRSGIRLRNSGREKPRRPGPPPARPAPAEPGSPGGLGRGFPSVWLCFLSP